MKPQRDQRKIIKEILQKRYMKEILCKQKKANRRHNLLLRYSIVCITIDNYHP